MAPALSTPSELRKTLDGSLLVRHISTKMETCCGEQQATEIRSFMEERNFDVIGLLDGDRVTRFIHRSSLSDGTCDSHGLRIEPTEIVSSTTSLIDLLPLMKNRDHMFVLEGARLESIVTSADLQKSPVRMLLFGLVSLLDVYLLAIVREHYPDDSFRATLRTNRLQEADKLFLKRKSRNEEIDLADCLQICDKRDLILRKLPCADLGFDSKRKALAFFEEAEVLRNRLAHSQDLVLGTRWSDVIDLATNLDGFLQRFD